jgi:hypothetical protein
MLKKTIKYTDFDGNERTEDFYFNFTKAEVAELELSKEGGLIKTIERITAAQNNREIVAIFKELILKAYGEKSPDGRRFVKNQELRDSFEQTEAYSELFIELSSDANIASEFLKGIIPKASN